MIITQKKLIKKQVTENLTNAEKIYSKMRHCIAQANNIYWCRNMNLAPSFEEDDYLNNLKISIPTLLMSINEFKDIYFINQKLCCDYPKLQEFSDSYFQRQINSFYSEICTIKKNIKQLKGYSSNMVLRNTVKHLEVAEKYTLKNLVEKIDQTQKYL